MARKKFTTDIDALRDEVEISYYRSSGPGGQHRNKTETAVRLVHPPSGITLRCSDLRSRHGNINKALKRLSERLIKRNTPPKKRKPSRPTRASKERRIKQKKEHSRKKRLRRKVRREGDE